MSTEPKEMRMISQYVNKEYIYKTIRNSELETYIN